jgi:hypothetical protein
MTASNRRGVRVLSRVRICTDQRACEGAELRADYRGTVCRKCKRATEKAQKRGAA